MTPEKIARYEIKSELGRGGMATVYLAYDPNFHRSVAVKVVSVDHRETPVFQDRFEREARLIARIEHPAIVPVYDFGEHEDHRYLVMRYMPGGTLADRIKQGGITFRETAQIFSQFAPALDAVHAQQIVHRDLKPGNILFDAFGNPAISDFGIAHLSAATVDLTGSAIIGTPSYMSPEQVRGEAELDGRSDVYALGVILFEMLTGRGPYHAGTPLSVALKHLSEPVPSVRAVRPDLPMAAEQILNRAMAKEPGHRYASASELARALETVAGTFDDRGAPLPGRATARRGEDVSTEVDLGQDSMSGLEPQPAPEVDSPRSVPAHTAGRPSGTASPPARSSRNMLQIIALAAVALFLLFFCGSVGLFGTWAGLGLPGLRPGENPTAPSTATDAPADTAAPTNVDAEVLLFSDDFTDPGTGWPTGQDARAGYGYESDGYHVAAYEMGSAPWVSLERQYADAAVYVDGTPVTQNAIGYYGLLCRIVDQRNFYYFIIQNTGQYAIGKYKDAEFQPLAEWQTSGAIRQGDQTNRLMAECVGEKLRLHVNGMLLDEVSDADFGSGSPGLIASAMDNQDFEVIFNNFQITAAHP